MSDSMEIVFSFIPYKQVGELTFGMPRQKAAEICGERRLSCMYGYPEEDRFLDDFGYMHTLCNNKELLEAVELFPDISSRAIYLKYGSFEIHLSKEPKITVDELGKITDDLIMDEDGEGYSSVKLGLKVYCPDGIVESVILHDRHCYEEEEKYIKNV